MATEVLDNNALLEEAFQAALAEEEPHTQVVALISLVEAGHQEAQEIAVKVVTTAPDDKYRNDKPHYKSGTLYPVPVEEQRWTKDWDIAHLVGAVARNQDYLLAWSLTAHIHNPAPKAEAYLGIGKAGDIGAFSMALKALKQTEHPLVSQTKELRTGEREIGRTLAEAGKVDELLVLRSDIEHGFQYVGPTFAFERLLTQAAIAAGDFEYARGVAENLGSRGFDYSLQVRDLLLMISEAGDNEAIEQAKRISRKLGVVERVKTLLVIRRIVEIKKSQSEEGSNTVR